MLDFSCIMKFLEELTSKAFTISLKFFWYITQYNWIDPIYYDICIPVITIFPYFFLKN